MHIPSIARGLTLVAAAVLLLTLMYGNHPATEGIALQDGQPGTMQMPRIGFGTCCRKSANGPPLIKSALAYLAEGGRLIDTAQMYNNHRALANAIEKSGVSRGELWLTSKVKTINGGLGYEATRRQVYNILGELRVDYLDLLLLHHAKGSTREERIAQWQALLHARSVGLVRNVGVSNYERPQIEELKLATGALPVVNQLEYHPWVDASVHALVQWCQANGIAVTAYGSLGSSTTGAVGMGPGVAEVAAKYGVTPAALLLNWALHKGCAVIPGATSAEHIRENLHVRRIALTRGDEERIASAAKPTSWRLWQNLRCNPGDRGGCTRNDV
jgi:diketogulonate reductase-like aldo/keto reductase